MEVYELINYDYEETIKSTKRVCAYARVSTLKDVAINSFDAQVKTYTNQIMENPLWVFAGVYADEGKSGTNLKHRSEFNNMMEVAKSGFIDLILTKSISRFARNTVDCLKSIQELKKYGTEVFFERENISSFDPKIEFVISVLSGLAEEEAKNVSENVKWNVRKRFKNGEVSINGKKIYGYRNSNDGKLLIDESQAPAIKAIYEMYLNNTSSTNIKLWLENNNFITNTGNTKWAKSSINYILKNDIYTGTLTMQKTLRPDFKSKSKINNEGQLPKYQVFDNHRAIISQCIYNQAQLLRKSRIKIYHDKEGIIVKNKYTTTSKYAGMYHCPHCGKTYRYKGKPSKVYNNSSILICSSNISKKGCQSEVIRTDEVDTAIKNQIDIISKNQDKFFHALKEAFFIRKGYKEDSQELEATQRKIGAYTQKLKSLLDSSNEFKQELEKEILIQISKLQQKETALQNRFKTIYDYAKYEYRFKQFLKQYQNKNIEYEELDYKKFFDKIIVYNKNKIIFTIGSNNRINKVKENSKVILNSQHGYLIRKTYNTFKYSVNIY